MREIGELAFSLRSMPLRGSSHHGRKIQFKPMRPLYHLGCVITNTLAHALDYMHLGSVSYKLGACSLYAGDADRQGPDPLIYHNVRWQLSPYAVARIAIGAFGVGADGLLP